MRKYKEKTVSATEAVRRFSEILNTVKYQGARYTIVRGGAPVAVIVPVMEASPPAAENLGPLLKSLPSLGDDADAEAFAADLEWVRKHQPPLPGAAWD